MNNYYILIVSFNDRKTNKRLTRHIAHFGPETSAVNRCERVKKMYQKDIYKRNGIENVSIQLLRVKDYDSICNFY